MSAEKNGALSAGQDGVEIAPAEGKLGVLLVGLGAVSTTFIAGVAYSPEFKLPGQRTHQSLFTSAPPRARACSLTSTEEVVVNALAPKPTD